MLDHTPLTRPWNRARRLLLLALALLGLATLARWNVDWPQIVGTSIDHCPELGCDFTRCFMPQARLLFRAEQGLVSGWLYPPLLAIALQVLRPLSDERAFAAWTALQLALAAVLVVQCRGVLRRAAGRWTSWLGAFGLVSLSLPVWHSIKWGQVSLLLCTLAITALQRETRLAASLLGGLAALKLYPALYGLAWLVSARIRPAPAGRWRGDHIACFAGTAIALGCLLPLGLLGWQRTAQFAERIAIAARAPKQELAFLGGQALRPSLKRWFVNGRHISLEKEGSQPLLLPLALGSSPLARGLRHALLGAILLPVALVSWRRLRAGPGPAPCASLLLLCVALAFSPGWHHYFAFLPYALATALACARPLALGLAGAAALASALPIVLLADVPKAYFHASAWGATTLAALLTWLALALSLPRVAAGAQAEPSVSRETQAFAPR